MSLLAKWTESTIRLPHGNQNQTNRKTKQSRLRRRDTNGGRHWKRPPFRGSIALTNCAYCKGIRMGNREVGKGSW
jgi:hypothetical protein